MISKASCCAGSVGRLQDRQLARPPSQAVGSAGSKQRQRPATARPSRVHTSSPPM